MHFAFFDKTATVLETSVLTLDLYVGEILGFKQNALYDTVGFMRTFVSDNAIGSE